MPLWLEYVQAGLILVIVVPGFVLLVIAIAWVLYAMFKVVY